VNCIGQFFEGRMKKLRKKCKEIKLDIVGENQPPGHLKHFADCCYTLIKVLFS